MQASDCKYMCKYLLAQIFLKFFHRDKNVKNLLQKVKIILLYVKNKLHLVKINIMSDKLLFPNKYKMVGWCILIPATILGIILIVSDFEAMKINTRVFAIFNDEFLGKFQSFSFINTNITNTVVGVLFLIGAILVGFSREKREDEFIANIRLSSLLWAVFVNYILLLFFFAFVYGVSFLYVMIYNMFTVLIIFIVRFNYILYRNSKTVSDEK